MSGFFFFNDTATTEIYTLSLHDALPISAEHQYMRQYNGQQRNLNELKPKCDCCFCYVSQGVTAKLCEAAEFRRELIKYQFSVFGRVEKCILWPRKSQQLGGELVRHILWMKCCWLAVMLLTHLWHHFALFYTLSSVDMWLHLPNIYRKRSSGKPILSV